MIKKSMSNVVFRLLLWASLVFVAVMLYKADYLHAKYAFSTLALVLSFPMLMGGFILEAVCIREVLRKSGCTVPLGISVMASGVTVFSKYIPGKVWTVVSKAAYIAARCHNPVGRVSIVLFNAQILSIWLGLLIGAIGLFALGEPLKFGIPILVLWLILTVLTFSRFAHASASAILSRLVGRETPIPHLRFRETLSLLPWFGLMWLSYAVAFFLFAYLLSDQPLNFAAGLGFVLASTAGAATVISPGGLGTREGVLVGYLLLAGLSAPEATSLAIGSRLWYFIGEAVFFLLTWLAGHRRTGRQCSADSSVKKPEKPQQSARWHKV